MTNQSNFRGLIAKLFQGCGHESRKGIYARLLNPFLPKMEIKTERKPVTLLQFTSTTFWARELRIQLELLTGEMKFLAKVSN